jgi:cytochrome c oxidase assembly factor CtaG/putative copper export protein
MNLIKAPTATSHRRRPLIGVLVGALVLLTPLTVLLVLGGSGELDRPGSALGDPGAGVRWALPAVRAVLDVSIAVTSGLLVLVATVLPGPTGARVVRELGARRVRAVRWAAGAGAVWTFSGIATIALTYADVAGVPLSLVGGAELLAFVDQFDLGRSLAISTAAAALITTVAFLATTTTTAGLLAVLAVAGTFPLALTGHSAGAANHGAAVDAQFAHVVALSIWCGGLAGLWLLRRAYADRFEPLLARFSTLAGWCFAIVAVSGVIGAVVRVPSPRGLLSSYGILLGAKTLCLLVLGVAGWWHRTRVLTGLRAGDVGAQRAFARIAAAELGVLGLAAGLGVALSRTSPTLPGTEEGGGESLLGYPFPPPLGLAQWFTQWRLDLFWLLAALALAGWYLHATWALRRRGDHWPVGRTLFWLLGCALLVWTTSGAPGVYGRALFSMHMVEHMTVAMVVPFLLVLGAPITLAMRTLPVRRDGSRGPREWLLLLVHSRWMRIIGHPVVASVVFISGTVIFYYTPLFDLALRTHTGHVLMTVHFLLSGYVFSWLICGIDPGPPRPVYPLRMIILMVSLAFHAFVGIAMMSSVETLGGEWFAALNRPWGPTLAEDQVRGGALAWALGDYPAALMSTALALRWIQSDRRERRRYDRQARRDGDAELRAYNEHLALLHRRSDPGRDPQ